MNGACGSRIRRARAVRCRATFAMTQSCYVLATLPTSNSLIIVVSTALTLLRHAGLTRSRSCGNLKSAR